MSDINFVLDFILTEEGHQAEVLSFQQNLALMEKTFSHFLQDFLKGDTNIGEVSCSVTICSNEEIRQLNYQHRQKNKATDVLSFPVHDSLRDKAPNPSQPILELGDIYISLEMAVQQAEEFNIATFDELVHLMIHGFCHLLGYDHEISDAEEALMEAKESEIISLFQQLKKQSI